MVASALVIGISGAVGAYWYFSRGLPLDIINTTNPLTAYKPKVITEIYSDDGALIGELAEEYRKVVPFEMIPPYVTNAFLASEDARFFEHKGLDFYRLGGAVYHNLRSGKLKGEGGSTITMQLTRTFYFSQKKLFSRKIKEMILAWRIDHQFKKDQVLWLYLNQIYLGTNMGRNIFGVEAASEQFFGKPINQVTLAEAAMLAGLPRAPVRYSPIYHFAEAKTRQRIVLRRMVETKMISEQESQLAESEPIRLKVKGDPYTQDSAYFIEAVRRYLFESYGEQKVLTEGLKVFTTINLGMQKAAGQGVRNGLAGSDGLDKREGYRGPLKQVKKTDLEKYLNDQEQKLKEQWQTRNVAGGGDPFAQPASPIPLELSRKYSGMVRELDPVGSRLKISVGQSFGWIAKENFKWALSGKPVEKVFQAGDVILVAVSAIKDLNPGKEYGFRLEQEPQAEAGLLAFSVRTGEIKALIGGYDFSKTQLIRPLQSFRQPGSAFKPVLYAAALDHPTKGFTPATIIYDSPDVFQYTQEDEVMIWKPDNYAGKFLGPRTLRKGLEKSINTISIKIAEEIGLDYVLNFLRKLGIKSPMKMDLTLALGSNPVSLLELTRAYNVFASGGALVEPHLIRRIYDREGNLLELHSRKSPAEEIQELQFGQPGEQAKESKTKPPKESVKPIKPKDISQPDAAEYLALLRGQKVPSLAGLDTPSQGTRVISPQLAYLMNNLLEGVATRGTGWKARSLLRPVAGKTGTTNQFRDALFIGYSPELICGVWVGFDEYSRSLGPGEAGAQAAEPIWIDFMKEALAGRPAQNFPVPDGIEFARIDQKTGLLASSCSDEIVVESFLAGTAPAQSSPCGAAPKTDDLLRSLDY